MKRTNERFGRIARKGLGALALGLLLLTGCLEQEEAGSEVPSRLGINFIAEKRAENAGLDGTAGMLDDLADLGAGCIRQANGQDVCWFTIYQGGDYGDPDSYDFSGSDELILGSAARGIQVIPTLFQIGGDSAVMNGAPDTKRLYTPDGEILKVTDVYEFLHGTRSKVIDYVTVVASRYRDHVQYFECANEVMAYGSYSANDYARLLICVKDALQAVDPDLKLVLGGLAGTEDVVFYHHLDWFEEVLEELEKLGGLDAIDVVNFHHYDEWKLLGAAVDALQEVMDRFGLGDLPILASEIGSSYVAAEGPAHTEDGSEEDQARDVVRKTMTCFAHGVTGVGWHAYISGTDQSNGSVWYGFGLRHPSGAKALSYHTFKFLSESVGRFDSIQTLSEGEDHIWAYRLRVPHEGVGPSSMRTVWILWSDGGAGRVNTSIDGVPGSTVKVTQLVPDSEGNFKTEEADSGDLTLLPLTPVLVELDSPQQGNPSAGKGPGAGKGPK